MSIVKISDEIPRNDPKTINTVVYTKELDRVFKENMNKDKTLRWVYYFDDFIFIRNLFVISFFFVAIFWIKFWFNETMASSRMGHKFCRIL